MPRGNEKWLLVQWEEGGLDIVHVRSLENINHEELQPGSRLRAFVKGAPKQGTFICKSNDRQLLDQMITKMKPETGGAPSTDADQEPGDFSASASSWQPSDDQASESDEAEESNVKLEHRRRESKTEIPTKRILTPSHRANAVIPEAMRRGNKITNRKRKHKSNERKSLSDSNRENTQCQVTLENVTVDLEHIVKIRECFRDLFKMVQGMKSVGITERREMPIKYDYTNTVRNLANTLTNLSKTMTKTPSDDEKENERSRSPESDRSEDNILISNKYEQYKGNNLRRNSPLAANPSTSTANGEWIPIGSGKTMLHRDKYKTVNWKSYTIATRTLLLALFPRRILATHSLTGKKSPAFQDKPAKMCLDPKIISDVIIEVQQRFQVKENLIRSIITTKCADECKMYKQRQKRRTTRSAEPNQSEKCDDDRTNITT